MKDRGRQNPRPRAQVRGQGKEGRQAVLPVAQPVTHLSDKYEAMRTPEDGWSTEEAGMAQLDDIVGSVMRCCRVKHEDNETRREVVRES